MSPVTAAKWKEPTGDEPEDEDGRPVPGGLLPEDSQMRMPFRILGRAMRRAQVFGRLPTHGLFKAGGQQVSPADLVSHATYFSCWFLPALLQVSLQGTPADRRKNLKN